MKLVIYFILTFSICGFAFAESSTMESAKKTKSEVQRDLEQGFEKLKVEVQELQESAKNASGSVKKDLNEQIANLKKDQKELQLQLEKLKGSSGAAWQDMKSGAADAYEKFKISVQRAKSRFDEKIEEKK